MLKFAHQNPTRSSSSHRSATDNQPRESHVQKAPVAFWLDSGGQLLQPGSSVLRVDAKVWYRWDGRVAGRRCSVHYTSTWLLRDKASGMRGAFSLPAKRDLIMIWRPYTNDLRHGLFQRALV